jgi:hypothetical protein
MKAKQPLPPPEEGGTRGLHKVEIGEEGGLA